MSTLTNVELVMRARSEGVTPPTVSELRGALATHGLPPDCAPDIPESTAFRRAADSLRKPASEGKPGIAARVWRTDTGYRCQVDREIANGHLDRSRLVLADINDIGYLTFDDGEILAEAVMLDEAYKDARIRYTWGDVTGVIRDVLSPGRGSSGTYALRDGVYVVPLASAEAVDELGRLELAIQSVGGALLRYQIPDSESHQAEIRAAILDDLSAALDLHATAIGNYSERTREHHFEDRLRSLEEFQGLLGRLSPIIGTEHAGNLTSTVTGLIEACRAAEEAARAAQPTGRRVVSSPALFA